MSLTEFELAVLDCAATPTYVAGQFEQRILDRLGCSTTIYFQTLNNLLDDPRAIQARPQLVNRLRRIRDARNAQRGHNLTEGE